MKGRFPNAVDAGSPFVSDVMIRKPDTVGPAVVRWVTTLRDLNSPKTCFGLLLYPF
ncbi:hypothetical protein [Paenibacillus sp. GCM10028914]|uniref:hypothetical protein n=1 Tax=Paenibacillus sp. GCM10028914 TaxID=3273416 RepID=UPI0036D36DD2